jgi:hypothetical protein
MGVSTRIAPAGGRQVQCTPRHVVHVAGQSQSCPPPGELYQEDKGRMPATAAAPRPFLLRAGPRLRRRVCRAQVSADATPLDDSERLTSDFRRLNRLRTLGGAPPRPLRVPVEVATHADAATCSPARQTGGRLAGPSAQRRRRRVLRPALAFPTPQATSDTLREKALKPWHSRHEAWTGCCRLPGFASSSRASRTRRRGLVRWRRERGPPWLH